VNSGWYFMWFRATRE